MTKIKITADKLLSIIQTVFSDNDIDIIENNGVSTSLQEVLNIEYYAFKYRPESSEQLISELIASGENVDELMALHRAFCCFSIDSTDRTFTNDFDTSASDCVLDYWIQVDKLKLLEQQIDRATRALSGVRLPVTFTQDGETLQRYAKIILSPISGIAIDPDTAIGEAANLSSGISILLTPLVADYSDYKVAFSWVDDNTQQVITSDPIPLSSFGMSGNMNSQSVPTVMNTTIIGSVNVSRALTFTLVFDGSDNAFINYLANSAIAGGLTTIENNKLFTMTLTRRDQSFTHEVILSDHSMQLVADTSNEVHNLTVRTRGLTDIQIII